MTTNELLAIARQRQQADALPYAGAVTPEEGYALLCAAPTVKLIDVRTQAERDWVGGVASRRREKSELSRTAGAVRAA